MPPDILDRRRVVRNTYRYVSFAKVESLTTTDLRCAIEITREWHEAGSVEELAVAATGALRELIGCDVAGWNELAPEGKTHRYAYPTGYLDDEGDAALSRHIDENPIVSYISRTARPSSLTFSDFLSSREYRRTGMYAEYYRARNVGDQLSCPVEVGSPIIALAFNRDRRTFGKRERMLLDLVRPHLAAAYAGIRDRGEAARRISLLERAHERHDCGVAVLRESESRPEALTAGGQRILDRWFIDGIPPIPLDRRASVVERDGVRLTVRTVDGEPQLLLLDERRVLPRPEHARELGLTRREAEILSLACRGASNSQIAGRLVLSARTVEKHLENAYAKLAVHSREEAVALLLDTPR
jgi:DNA-binding CsgD family transcriptional regulator